MEQKPTLRLDSLLRLAFSLVKWQFREFSESIGRAREELKMIVRYYEGDRLAF